MYALEYCEVAIIFLIKALKSSFKTNKSLCDDIKAFAVTLYSRGANTIVNGTGIVHSDYYNLSIDYNIKDRLILN